MKRRHFIGLVPSAALPAVLAEPSPQQQASRMTPAEAQKIEAAASKDAILHAILAEIARFRSLKTSAEPLYFIEVAIDDAETFGVSATLGAAFAPARARLRPIRARIRVGNPSLDNTNSIYTDFSTSARFDSDTLPLDDDVLVLRHALWLNLDRHYKTAAEALGRKRAMLRAVTQAEPLPDFWTSPALLLIQDVKRIKIDEAAWEARVKALSAIFSAYPNVTASSVDFEFSQGGAYYANTEAVIVRIPDRVAMVRVRASCQAPDGMVLYNGAILPALEADRLPSEPALRTAVEDVARELASLSGAPVARDPYAGPVLFEARAAAQIFAEVFAGHLAPVRKPVAEPGRTLPILPSELENRLNSRVLPEWMSVIDDATLQEADKRPLAGYYQCDLDGVAPARLTLVENGVLKQLLTTRQPVRGMSAPNGHARLPGMFGAKTARISNLFVRATKTQPLAQLKAQLIETIRSQSKPCGYIVRKMDFPSAGSAEELRRTSLRTARAGGRPISTPILLFRVFPDGREELVRGLRFRSFTTRAFRDILAAGDLSAQFDYIDNGAPLALMGAGNYVVGCSVIAPALLFEELELEPLEEDLAKPPVVPPPPAGGTGLLAGLPPSAPPPSGTGLPACLPPPPITG